jgi:hypothetical protein
MPDELRSPIKHHLVLHRIDPEQGIRRFYSPMMERELFGTVRLVRNWGGSAPTGRNWSRCSTPSLMPGRRSRRWPRPSASEGIGICNTCERTLPVAGQG